MVLATTTTVGTIKSILRERWWDGLRSKDTNIFDRAAYEGLYWLAGEYDWDWYSRYDGRAVLQETFITGTVAVNKGSKIVTLTGGVFPTFIDADTWILTGQKLRDHRIATRDSDTQITLDTDHQWLEDNITGSAFTVYRVAHPLPTDFMRAPARMIRDNYFGKMNVYSEAIFEELRQEQLQVNPTWPQWCSFAKNKILVWPPPHQDMVITFAYLRLPTKHTSDSDNIDWPNQHMRTALAAMDYHVATELNKRVDKKLAILMEEVSRSRRAIEPVKGPQDLQPMPLGVSGRDAPDRIRPIRFDFDPG